MMSLAWPFDACCMIGAGASGLGYAIGLARLWHRAGIGRGVSRGQAASFLAGWFAATLPVLSPLHGFGIHVFSLHMLEHELLMAVAAPLFILSSPTPVFLWALPRRVRRRVRSVTHARGSTVLWNRLTAPGTSAVLHGVAIWTWHLPGPFQAALFADSLHAAQHICFLGTALLFWYAVLSRIARRRAPVGPALALLATSLHSSLLGALLTFSRGLWYPGALDPFVICGLTRGEDQQLAGLIMWVPGGTAYLAGALWLVGRHLLADSSVDGSGIARPQDESGREALVAESQIAGASNRFSRRIGSSRIRTPVA
jgi:putative membrane protein